MIKFENVYLKYSDNFFCLYNINFTMKNNTLIIGDEYLGSSSILRLISKIDTCYTGHIFIEGLDLKNIKNKDLSVAYVPQLPELFLHKNLYKNLLFPLKIRKNNKNEAKNIVNCAISKYNLEKFSKKIKYYSLSEKKIFSLIRASLRKPKYILLENFFDNLEEKYISLALQIIEDIKQVSTIIACEKKQDLKSFYSDFEIYNL